jgi:hypothetical protein
MKTSALLQSCKVAGLAWLLTSAFYGCSSSSQGEQGGEEGLEQSQEDNAAEANQQGGEENASNEGGENNAAMNNLGDQGNDGSQSLENVPAEGNAIQEANPAPMNQVAQEAPPVNAAPANAAPAAPVGDGSRVVRFVTMNGTPVLGGASASSAQVASLNQGDAVVVSITGGWAMIADGRYVAADKLSEKAVPRAQASNSWN